MSVTVPKECGRIPTQTPRRVARTVCEDRLDVTTIEECEEVITTKCLQPPAGLPFTPHEPPSGLPFTPHEGPVQIPFPATQAQAVRSPIHRAFLEVP